MIPLPLPAGLDRATVEAFVARTLDEAEAEGLPRHVTDPAVLDLVARIVLSHDEGRAMKPPKTEEPRRTRRQGPPTASGLKHRPTTSGAA